MCSVFWLALFLSQQPALVQPQLMLHTADVVTAWPQWPQSICDGVLPSPWGLAAWVRAARAAPVMRNHPKSVPAINCAAARGDTAQGSACTHCWGWERCCWQRGVLGAQLPVPPSGKSSGCPGDQKASGHSPGQGTQGGRACARWEWTGWSLEAPSNLSYSMFSVISKKTGVRCERFLGECEMWPYLFKWCHCNIFWSFNSVLSLFSIKRIFYVFFGREQNGDSVLMGLESHWVQVLGLM